MFIIFGWEKGAKEIDNVMHHDCYNCQNHTQWTIWKETEWVSLFFVKVIPILNKYYIGCSTCGDSAEITTQEAKSALSEAGRTKELHDILVSKIEKHQFHGLTEGQINYKKTQFEFKKNT